MDKAISLENVTKDYGAGMGNFGISFDVAKGEAFGLVGENGAGKTTLIRQVMGFIRPKCGKITILGNDAYKSSSEVKKFIGYVPGEINFPDLKTGKDFLRSYAEMKGIQSTAKMDELIKRLQLDIRAYPRRMSKGMKQKLAIVAAFGADCPILVLDEPTTGLDPLMREEFLKLIKEERDRGKTILISSNSVEELERTCDRVAMITKGRIVAIADVKAIRDRDFRDFKIEFKSLTDYEDFIKDRTDVIRNQPQYYQATVRLKKCEINSLLDRIAPIPLKFISEVNYTLASYFAERSKANGKESQA